MPFTVTHIAAAFPIAWLYRGKLPFTALALGCMICDLPVFFPNWIDYYATHSVQGLITHCLPLGWVAYIFFHLLLKRPLIALMPRSLAGRLSPLARPTIRTDFRGVAMISLCLVGGAATHVFWDSFTHMGRWGVNQFPVLNEIVYDYSDRPVRWYSVLQHGSSVVFLPLIFVGGWRWLMNQPLAKREDSLSVSGWVRVLAIGLCLGLPLATGWYLQHRYPWAPAYRVVHETVKLSGTMLILSAGLYGSLFTALMLRKRRTDDRPALSPPSRTEG